MSAFDKITTGKDQASPLNGALSSEAFSATVHSHLDRNARVMMDMNKAIWKHLDAAVAAGSTASEGIRAASENAAQQSGQYAHNLAVAGEAFARAKSPTDYFSAQQDLLRSASTDMAAGARKNGETLSGTMRAISQHWAGLFAATMLKGPKPKAV